MTRHAPTALLLFQRRLAGASLPADAPLPDDRALGWHLHGPALVLVAILVLAAATAPFPGAFALLVASEQGVVENVTALAAAYGVVVAFKLVRHGRLLPHRWMAAWFGCFVVGLAFVALEEISWGQQWLFWRTPRWIGLVNTQGETNLHNLSRWSEALPKLALSAAAMLGGILVPLWILWRGPVGLIRRTPLGAIWPSAALWPSAAIAFVLRMLERVVANQPGADSAAPLFRSLREALELFLILFVLAYLLDLRARYLGTAPARQSRAGGRDGRARPGAPLEPGHPG